MASGEERRLTDEECDILNVRFQDNLHCLNVASGICDQYNIKHAPGPGKSMTVFSVVCRYQEAPRLSESSLSS
jgi:hypothetical protein